MRAKPTRVRRVPQIWLTYDELGVLMNCDPMSARATAIAVGLDRRRSRDGKTRAKLSPSLTDAFLEGVLQHRLDQAVAGCAADLRAMHDRMATQPAASPQPARFIAG
jgi:hypothetical protein